MYQVNEQTIKSYLAGKLSEMERQQVEQFLNTGEGEAYLNQVMDQVWSEEDIVSDREVFERVEEKLQNHISISKQKAGLKWARLRGTLAIAASIALLAIIGLQYFLGSDPQLLQEPEPFISKLTTKGLKSTVQLPDGSKVMMNSESKVSYPKYFSDSSRMIYLEGEAFFDVAKDKSRPFTVIANGISITALGTSFNINGRGDQCKVSLATGKVEVHQLERDENYFLKPGEAVQFDVRTGLVRRTEYEDFEDYLWTKGIIAFKDDPFDRVIEKLSRWYNVEFNIENAGIVKQYTGRYDNKSLEAILENMSFTLGFDYFIHERQVKIIFEN